MLNSAMCVLAVLAPLHDGMFISGDLVLPPSQPPPSQQQQQLPTCSSPDPTMLDAHHFAVSLGGSVSASTTGQAPVAQSGQSVFGHHSEIHMTETW